ncbi:TPM domain-containing protein [Mycobacterium koreense]|uniref:Uncharacterized protein n=1 Tax=Mycolicibacillus koreensis TaxID=1069220 RepID=A0A7I7SAD0_9MYCO|nr:TPM domain-containing protein [Mycolicibacillus koreensis]MCV7249245.1 TPM domain-containing protein [Mycolicibacillus koreensis]ODR10242.1 hypothetical protein BHQ15_05390 [Mycolicibacillus koreensis]OSC35603.1 hypothetical protein B8W67_02470 [Mycolicibacillus koreensis]BBY53156.1 membrane protein [Mycolicibacillus koreensis]
MRTVRLLAAALATVLTALLGAPGALADEPLRLANRVTDHASALTDAGRTEVASAIAGLYNDHRIRLWVIYVDTFSGQSGDSWARSTARLSDLGDHDALLAVATGDRSYAFLVSTGLDNISAGDVDELRRNRIEPALGRGDWGDAAVAAATGLASAAAGPPMPWATVLGVLAAVAVALMVLLAVLRWRRRRRHAAMVAAAHRVDPTDTDALARLPIYALDALSRSKVVDVDNAVRTSTNELALAAEEFGDARTQPFRAALDTARAALAHAFAVRQQLDDDIPETPTQQRDLLTGVIVAAAEADGELENQRDAFDRLRDLVINAPAKLDGLTQQVVELTARRPGVQQRLTELRGQFSAGALASVIDNPDTAAERVAFAERNIDRARALLDHPVAGQQGELVDCVRAAESAVGQAKSLLNAVDSAAGDIRHAEAALPAAISDIEAAVARADEQLTTPSPHAAALAAARTTAAQAVADARGGDDPLGAFARITEADADLDAVLETVAEEQAAAERQARVCEQALFTAQARVRAVSDYIDTRRGSVGPEARTRLAEARKRLEMAESLRTSNPNRATNDAHAAAALAAQAQTRARADAQAAQQAYAGRYGSTDSTGAMLGGIIIGNILSGGFGGGSRGGSGGWRPTSFGGSGGGFFGGGGRF